MRTSNPSHISGTVNMKFRWALTHMWVSAVSGNRSKDRTGSQDWLMPPSWLHRVQRVQWQISISISVLSVPVSVTVKALLVKSVAVCCLGVLLMSVVNKFLLIILIKIHIRVCFNDIYWLLWTPHSARTGF